ncbi:hypothetical protein FisN_26Hh146 [Fistulifera solaris]|uniref:Uncharacterized protein n=1 Tax=Fistulifera solaris TaxID=1519565 RepID=A0A1Z5JXW8_FISSO|nr:hypothetical protein FisN_26Hh146 [Fistulifera solaris]|eukprot:GAX18844.1 hypothetical protein FisN_26Hh146 [Fistulifera solaris]
MSNEYEDRSLLLGMIPYSLREPDQVVHWQKAGESPTYKLLRQPRNLEELTEDCKHGLAIWRDNDTLTYVTPPGTDDVWDRKKSSSFNSSLWMLLGGTALQIFGYSENAISETAAFFMNLVDRASEVFYLEAVDDPWGGTFDFGEGGYYCFTRLLKRGSVRRFIVKNVALSADQSRVLASHPNSMQMELSSCAFDDNGTAFVDELEKRQSSFGSLKTDMCCAFDHVNLRRIFKLKNVFDHLRLPYLADEVVLLSLSAHSESLELRIFSRALSVEDCSTLRIETKKLALYINHDIEEPFPTELMIAFWRRVSELGHFVELKVAIILCSDVERTPIPIAAPLMEEMTRAIMANRNLQILDLTTYNRDLEWRPHMATLFNSLKDHKELRTLRMEVDDESQDFGPGMCHLRNLLWQKRDITVTNCEGGIITDNNRICALYSLNRLYWGSASLVGPPTPHRSSLVTTALLKSTAQSFQRSSLLLADHLEVLHELVQSAQLDHDLSPASRKKKRRRKM